MRSIPATMATQHPDNASSPYWLNKPHISTLDEVEEAYRVFAELNCDEYMWDWEGKFVDEAVVDRLFHRYADYFSKNQLGRDKFLTFRVPNIWKEKGTRIARAFMAIITAAHTADAHKVHTPPLFEVILPMTTSASQLSTIQRKFKRAARYEKDIFEKKLIGDGQLEMIPLIEGSASLLESKSILKAYARNYQKIYGKKVRYLRPFIARSDPALDAGMIAATLSAKGAISEYYRFQKESGIPVFPILGVGCPIFRGGFAPTRIERFLKLYGGVRTVTIQSAFRYDYPADTVKKAIATLKKKLPKTEPIIFSDKDTLLIHSLTRLFAQYYRPVVLELAETINDLAQYIPQNRERIPHTGHFGYSRRIEKSEVPLPRAIGFTAVFLSLGIPPSLIGSGRGLIEAIKRGDEAKLRQFFPLFDEELITEGRFLNWENLKFLAKKNPAWGSVREDIRTIEDYLGQRLGPTKPEHFIHRNLTSNIFHYWQSGNSEKLKQAIVEAAVTRHFLG